MLRLLHSEVLQQLGDIAFGVPSVHLGKLLLQFGGAVAVFFGHLGLRVDALALLHVIPKWLMPHEHSVHNRELVVLEVVLIEHAEAFARSQFHASLVGFQFSADGFQQR